MVSKNRTGEEGVSPEDQLARLDAALRASGVDVEALRLKNAGASYVPGGGYEPELRNLAAQGGGNNPEAAAARAAGIEMLKHLVAIRVRDPQQAGELLQFESDLSAALVSNDTGAIMEKTNAVREAIATAEARLSDRMHDAQDLERREGSINAMHRELYANDAVYRAQTDAISAQADKTIAGLDAQVAELDALAKKHHIETAYDEVAERVRRQLEEAIRNGDHMEARKLQVQWAEVVKQQTQARIEVAEEQGKPEVAAEIKEKHVPKVQNAVDDTRAQYDQQAKAYLEAFERSLAQNEALSPQERKEKLKSEEQAIRKQREALSPQAIKDLTGKLRDKVSNLEAKGPAQTEAQSPVPQLAEVKFGVAEVSPAEALPSPQPNLAQAEFGGPPQRAT